MHDISCLSLTHTITVSLTVLLLMPSLLMLLLIQGGKAACQLEESTSELDSSSQQR
jgi:hypothetical protein